LKLLDLMFVLQARRYTVAEKNIRVVVMLASSFRLTDEYTFIVTTAE